MDKSFNKNVQQPYIPKGSTIYKPVIPEKKPSDEMVNNLFLVIADGNYFKIKEHMFSNNVLMTSKNGSGESALHIILKNSNITSHEKKELIQFAITKGAQVNAYDVNNISPLHLACKYQLPDIIKLLLSYGANVNALDNQYKTPLHYAVTGDNIDCQNDQKEKIKPLIPKNTNVFKINKVELNDNNKQLNSAITEFFTDDVETKKFTNQIKSSFDSIEDMFPFLLKELKDKNKQEIIDVLINSSANDENKKQEIFSKIMEIKTSLTEHLNLQVKASIDPLVIKANSIDGWGPGNLQQNKVLPVTSLEDYTVNIDKQLGSDRHSKVIDMQKSIGNLDKEVNVIKKYNSNCVAVIGNCHVYSNLIGQLTGDALIQNMNEIDNILCENPNDLSMKITIPIVDDNVEYNFVTENYTNTVPGVANPHLLYKSYKFQGVNIVNPARIRISKNDVNEYVSNNGRQPNKLQLSLPFNVGGNVNIAGSIPINIANPIGNSRRDPRSVGLYFNTKVNFYINYLEFAYGKLKRHLVNINSGIDADPDLLLPILYEREIPGAVTQLLNITLLLASINDSINLLNLGFSDLYTIYDNMKMLPFFSANSDKLFVIEQITDDIRDIAQQDVTKMCKNIYESVKNIVKNLNGMISYIESMSASKCIDSYFKYNSFDIFYTSQDSPEISNIVAGPLQKIREFPNDLLFVNASGSNTVERRKNLIEQYMMQVTLANLPIGIVDDNDIRHGRIPGLSNLPTIGYLPGQTITDIPTLCIDTLNGGMVHPIKLSEMGQNPTKALNSVATLIGKIAYRRSERKHKETFSYPIIGSYYAIYLTMLKYAIIRYIINLSYDLLNGANPTNQYEANLKTLITKLNNNVKQLVKFDANDYGFILTMVGRSIDKYLINFINGNIATKINELLLKMIRNNIPQHYTNLLNTVFAQIIPTAVLNPDNGISLDMDELFEDLMILHQKNLYTGIPNDHNVLRDIAVLTIGNLNEEYTKKKKIHKITNFDSETQTRNEICYKYDQDVIKELLAFNAKVNLKDAIGNTPLYYAIETGNILAVKELKKYGAIIYSAISTNKFGKCALEYAWELYATQLQKQIGNKYEVCKNATDKIIQKLKKNEKYSNNVPKYTSLIFPMALYLLNHQFYLTGKGYAYGWNYTNNEEFETSLGLIPDCPLPLLNANLDAEEFEPHSYIESSKQQLSLKTDLITILITRKKSLFDELTNLNSKPRPISHIDNLRFNQIQEALQQIDADILKFSAEINAFNNKITTTDTFSKGIKQSLKNYIDRNKQHFKLHHENVTDIYNSVFVDVINYDVKTILDGKKYYYSTDMRTYPLMWKKYLQNVSRQDYTQVVDLIVEYQKQLLNDTKKSSLEKIRDVRLVAQYHSKIINPFCEHYFELEQVYGETNYAMTKIINIIVHVVKHTLCVNLFGFIVKALTKFVLNTMPKHQYSDKGYAHAITQLIIEIIDTNRGTLDGSHLMNYIFEILPLKLVKTVLQIYEGPNDGEDDLDKRLTPESIFNHINKILESSTTIELKDKSSLLLNLREYVYPFYIDYSTNFIKEMKNLIDSYMRQLQGDFNMLNILDELSQK